MYSYSGISTNTSHIIFRTKINKILLNMLNEMVVDQTFLLNILGLTKVSQHNLTLALDWPYILICSHCMHMATMQQQI